MSDPSRVTPDLSTLVNLFYSDPTELGQFAEVDAERMPSHYHDLLAHQNHMTVTVERFHGAHVNVEVLHSKLSGDHYSRKILLRRASDNRVVQFGIVRLCFEFVSPAVREQVESRSAPLGRILIENDVLREVHLFKLWKITAGADLAAMLNMQVGGVTYGRTAIIDCNRAPAVELLEIVAPAEFS